LTLLQLIWRNDAVPLGRSNNKKRKGTIYISKYVSAMKDAQRFVQISPERLLQTASKTRTRSASKEQKGKNKNKHRETPSRDAPQWYRRTYITATRSATRSNRSRRLRRRKRHTRINHEMLYISRTPTNERLFKAANQYNYYLRIHDDGTVDGTLLENDPRTLLKFESHAASIIRIKGVKSGRYLTMDQKGIPKAVFNPNLWNSLFRWTQEENHWETLASYRYYFEKKYDMLVGITKVGQVKKPWKAAPGQHATQFICIKQSH